MEALIRLRGVRAPVLTEVEPDLGLVHWEGRRLAAARLPLEAPARNAVYGVLFNFPGELAALGTAVNAAPYLAPPKAPVLYIKPANT